MTTLTHTEAATEERATKGQLKQITRMAGDVPDSEPVQEVLAGLSKEEAERVKGNADFTDTLRRLTVETIRIFKMPKPDYTLATQILGDDFLKPEDIAKARNLVYPDSMLSAYGNSLPSEEDLVWCRDNKMVLVAGPEKPRATLSIRELDPTQLYSKTGGWYADNVHTFARKDAAVPAWLAFKKGAVDGSFNRRWDRQEPLVKAPMFVPNMGKSLWIVTSVKAVRNIDLLPDFYVRTSSVSASGNHVYFGYSLSGGLSKPKCWSKQRKMLEYQAFFSVLKRSRSSLR